MNTSSDEQSGLNRPDPTKEERQKYWDNYKPKLVTAEDANYIGDWRSVELEYLSPLDRRLVTRFRNRARELGLELANAPEAATDLYKPPFTDRG